MKSYTNSNGVIKRNNNNNNNNNVCVIARDFVIFLRSHMNLNSYVFL